MAEFHVAGRANDPELAEAEAIIEDLAMNLPDVTLVRHIKDPVRGALIEHHSLSMRLTHTPIARAYPLTGAVGVLVFRAVPADGV